MINYISLATRFLTFQCFFSPGKFVQKQRKEFQDRLADAGTQAEEALSSIRTVRMFSGEVKAKGLYGREVDRSYRVGRKLALAQGRGGESRVQSLLPPCPQPLLPATSRV